MNIEKSNEFKKEFKKYLKKYPTLAADLETLEKAIATNPEGNGSKHWNVLKKSENEKYVIKVRMMCRALKGSSFRVIYYYDGQKIDLIFLEIYYKGKKESEDKERIKSIWSEKTNGNLTEKSNLGVD